MYARLTAEEAANRVEGPLLFLHRTLDVGYNEAVEVEGSDGVVRLGRVATVDNETIVIEVLDDTAGLALSGTRVRFFGESLKFQLGPGILDRVFNGVGKVIDGGPPIAAVKSLSIDGLPIKPTAREAPKDFLETGITAIDLMNSLVRGQKLPLFSGGGLPHDQIAVSIAANARLPSEQGDEFVIVFAGIGVPHESAEYFQREMERSGALERSVLFLNLASDSSAQRLLTPRYALTAAEYLAFHEGKHVLVIMTDMTNYCEALREVSASKGEIPSRKGYPGYMYSDLATLFERAGRIKGLTGTLTQLPILTMPNDDIGHPIPDLSGYITEGQIVLDRDLHRRGIYPPVKVLPSLSRLMKDGTGNKMTDPDHPALADQLYAAYAHAQQARILASVVGEEGLTEVDRKFLQFGQYFESSILGQSGSRTLLESMAEGWKGLKILPQDELHRLSDVQIKKYLSD
ncbi:MAG: V-type ATP synthase subunit B [Gammaproteobacteria bacterium]|jgi:V/A-type H+-transporting ATPase subunit B|nr:V-type ATP synthase subunit B [Gammaproteobacteria bacterium]MBT3725022.1 V-type ATP synthase subunit B [Gammaproteobacteria bacterium]MBT4193854.1 V-type ATP synthase subunit B [Gammaproteobacteria bacterium]MBT4449733.1 V-type ATP synthase subunit B [Gammaproteobacteria bacterium]MBT4863287.1 V-type ATP synthase subunit B [Gammaproteobacteria bacterium]